MASHPSGKEVSRMRLRRRSSSHAKTTSNS